MAKTITQHYKIYIDKDKRITGHEIVFYDVKQGRPETNINPGFDVTGIFIGPKQRAFIDTYLVNGGKITDLIYNKGKLIENKRELNVRDLMNCPLPQTIIINPQDFIPNSDLKRHLKETVSFSFQELKSVPMDKINTKYLYQFDKMTLEFEITGKIKINQDLKRYFGLFDGDKLAAFIFLVSIDIPKISVLYYDQTYNNAGYVIVNNLIEVLKKEGNSKLDLGGLTRNDSGINQFKKKFGKALDIPL